MSPMLARKSFPRGWVPNADYINGPDDGLLRMDNLVLDELGVLALRAGSDRINSVALADTDIHTLFTVELNGSRKRMTGANDAVYANGTSIISSVNGSGDMSFGSYLGQIFVARGTTKKKYDGTTVRNWGISMTGGVATVTGDSGSDDSATWVYVYVRNNGVYNALSAPSVATAAANFDGDVTVTTPIDLTRDSQVNEIWLFRRSDLTDGGYYRVKVATGVSGTGAVAINDTTSAEDALIINIALEDDNAIPPSTIIDIEGPYYDRIFALTATSLYMSRRLNPDSFSASQVILISDADETCLWVKKGVSGGLFVGTTKDIYVLDGTGAEYPDGTIEFTLRPLNIDNPPRSVGSVAQEGNQLVYLAADGWRAMVGAGSALITGDTSLLYKGKTRHGVLPVNLTTGRLRSAIAKNRLWALTPEGASTNSTPIIYRFEFDSQRWYRFDYGDQEWAAIYREPDGTLIAGDRDGFVWVLDTGTNDDGALIPVEFWTKADDDGKPFQRKDAWDLRIRANTGQEDATVQVHIDGREATAQEVTVNEGAPNVTMEDLSSIGNFRQAQLRVTGGFSTFVWYDHGIGYREHPALQVYTENKPDIPSPSRRRFGGVKLTIDTLAADVTVTPLADGSALDGQTVNTPGPLGTTLTFPARLARDLWVRISSPSGTGFELYGIEPLILDTLPPTLQGIIPPIDAGDPGQKTMSGVQIKCCTLGESVTVDTIIDRVVTDTFTIESNDQQVKDFTLAFPKTYLRKGAEIQLRFNGEVELYSWRPLITATRPLGVKAWDSGPIDLGLGEFIWPREIWLKVEAAADLVVIPYFDGVTFQTVTCAITAAEIGTASKVRIPIPRGFKGRVPRFEIRSAEAFYPYWIEFTFRQTRADINKTPVRVNAMVGGGTGVEVRSTDQNVPDANNG